MELKTRNPSLLPWALLMNSSDEQVRDIERLVTRQDNVESLVRFVIMASLRYDIASLQEMFGVRNMALIRALMDGSSLVQEERDKAWAEGQVSGRKEGEVHEAPRFLRRLLRKNFPELASMPEIDQISTVEALESLGEAIVETRDADRVREAILAAARPN
jgi:hypothetical protein